MKRTVFFALAMSLLGGTAAVTGATAAEFVALVGDRTLIRIDLDTRQVVGRATVEGSSVPLAIDVRPADGKLYGLFEDGTIAVIAPKSGRVRLVSTLSVPAPEAQTSIDFNPVVDRLRIVSITGQNLRANVDDGVAVVDTPINFAQPNEFGDAVPAVVGIAYTNSAVGAATTQLFDIDSSPEALYEQIPPNAGTLVAVGPLSVQLGGTLGFDIQFEEGRNRGFILSRNRLYRINLETGAVVSQRKITGLEAGERARDIAFLPSSAD